MKSNDYSALWGVLKDLRDTCRDPLLKTVLDLAMLATTVERDAMLEDAEPGADPDK